MKNLINFFFSFEKLFKEKLVVPFFWLALIVAGLAFSAEALKSISLKPLASLLDFVGFFAEILLVLISIRIVSEIFVAIFRINDNLSPDGGKAELADIDPVAEARKAAELAASRTREMAKSAPKPTAPKSGDVKSEASKSEAPKPDAPKADPKPTPASLEPAQTKAEDVPVTAAAAETGPMVKRGRGRPKGSTNKPKTAAATSATKTEDQPVKRGRGRPKGSKNKHKTAENAAPAASAEQPVKRGRGRPKGSKNKPKAATVTSATKTEDQPVKRGRGRPKGSKNKPKAAETTTKSKPGPKPGSKAPRDADGNLLKKDGTPRKKPGPKPKAD